MKLRDYQLTALEAVLRELRQVRSTLVVMPTGTGKTILFAAVAAKARGRVLILAHREELVDQAVDKLHKSTGITAGVEMADRSVDLLFPPSVIVGSVQTLSAKRRAKFPPDMFSLVIVDECHHATAKSYREILDHFGTAKVLGVTATPDRLDGTGMKEVFQSAAFVYEIRDAIEQCHLSPIHQQQIVIDGLDLSGVKTHHGDFSAADLERVMMEERTLHAVAVPTIERAKDRPTIIFTAGVAQALALADVLRRYEAKAEAIHGGSSDDERKKAIQSFHDGKLQYLVNCALLAEGFDAPLTSCIVIARPTKSRALYAQMVGRGTRPCDGKDDLLVLDFVGNAGKHSLVNVCDILDGNQDAQLRAMTMAIMGKDPEKDVLEAMTEAEEQLTQQRRLEVLCKVAHRASDIDPFAVLQASDRPGRWGGIPPTFKQLEVLDHHGIDGMHLDKGQASALIERLFQRRKDGLCTFKQARILAIHGEDPDMPFEPAKQKLDEIFSRKRRGRR